MSLRIGIGASSSNAESDCHQTTSHGSTVYDGHGDVTMVAREGDMKVAEVTQSFHQGNSSAIQLRRWYPVRHRQGGVWLLA